MNLEEINTLTGKTIILRRKMFIGNKPYHDIECDVCRVLGKSIMCRWKGVEGVFIPIKFFMESRAILNITENKPIVYLPNWFHF